LSGYTVSRGLAAVARAKLAIRFPLPVGRGWREAPGEGPSKKMLGYSLQDRSDVLGYLVVPKAQSYILKLDRWMSVAR
jgi:hypothetical protein